MSGTQATSQQLTVLSPIYRPPKWSMPGRRSEGREVTPGPGAYSPGTTKRRQPHWGFGTSKREPFKGGLPPGPGTYDLTMQPKTPKWSMKARQQVKLPPGNTVGLQVTQFGY
ncbi:unnamed protein product [Vitrella brassicaformis CCMP3155]|uniref:Uncharacterized protein n=1 Tax=Vitrella brassicaformis (strain CCMP3155) TaxID=1169540 RepID=A0A0G4EX71_VITBC|nr:unnamed protein product [Vitrella brassicaformis CCMP3155]|mmetsp:Transcript_41067/g.102588  ORF Transcript_41067/g.102588 Transcript_41067/m.102588 type:complete len:112 (-) Transcript_41067:181-516(-)|eukprot:CEM03602.1 unnamed protein product [Vitrella brassicaformis CCMP3155]